MSQASPGQRPRLVAAVAVLLSLVGIAAWMFMPRQEDPSMPSRWALLVAIFPGAGPEKIEQLVVDPIEDELSSVAELRIVSFNAGMDSAGAVVELRDDVYETEAAWNSVRRALERAQPNLPDDVEILLDDTLVDTEAVVYALSGTEDLLLLQDAARLLKQRLESGSLVKKVALVADPGRQVTVLLDDATAKRLSLTPQSAARQLQLRNTTTPGGYIDSGGRQVLIQPNADFKSLEEIGEVPLVLQTGTAVPLGEIASVGLGPKDPPSAIMRANGQPAVGVSVIPRNGINLVSFGDQIREIVEESMPLLPPEVVVDEAIFQPKHVESRLGGLGWSLFAGIVIVAGVLFISMGKRVGLAVSAVVPMVAFSALAVYFVGGGVFHQMSIAAIVLSLGLVVDNAIVITEAIQERIDRGQERALAIKAAVKSLWVPLGAATGTTVSAFVPMILAKGSTGDFTRAVPIVVILMLVISYIYAVLVTPMLAGRLLEPNPGSEKDRWHILSERVSVFSSTHPWRRLALGAGLMATALFMLLGLKQQFFPISDRGEVLITISMPHGTDIKRTDEAAREVEAFLLQHPDVPVFTTYVGETCPRFYYNLPIAVQEAHLAQIVVDAQDIGGAKQIVADVEAFAAQNMPHAEVVPTRLQQGPFVGAPVQVRLYHDDITELYEAAEAVASMVRGIEGTRSVGHTLGMGTPTLDMQVNDVAAQRRGITRDDVALAMLGHTLGVEVGQFRGGDKVVPIVMRAPKGVSWTPEEIATIDVTPAIGQAVPLMQVAKGELRWQPSVIRHYNGRRVVTVSAQLNPGAHFSEILGQIKPQLDQVLPFGMDYEFGGDVEGAGDANAAIIKNFPVGAILLLMFLLLEFDSYSRVLIILTTVPLCAVGIIPGLVLSGQPFGFMSLLGTIALVGIVVNNAIVLLDVVDAETAKGSALVDSVRVAVQQRTRPILLTTVTTVAGLLPLAFGGGSLWPPLAFAMSTGLIASTFLSLAVVPAITLLVLGRLEGDPQAQAPQAQAPQAQAPQAQAPQAQAPQAQAPQAQAPQAPQAPRVQAPKGPWMPGPGPAELAQPQDNQEDAATDEQATRIMRVPPHLRRNK